MDECPELQKAANAGSVILAREKPSALPQTIARSLAAGNPTNQMRQQRTPKPFLKPKPTKPLSPPRIIYNPYKKEYYFSREDTPDEIAWMCHSIEKAERWQACQNEVHIDSIREENYLVDPAPPTPIDTPPDAGEAPIFPTAISNELPVETVELLTASDNDCPANIAAAAATLWSHVEILFIKAPAVFINQYVYNKKSDDMSKHEVKAKSTTAASEIVSRLGKEPVAIAKTVETAVAEAVVKESAKTKRKLQSQSDKNVKKLEQMHAELLAERKKRQKNEQEIERLKSFLADSKNSGAEDGATETNGPSKHPKPSKSVTIQAPTQKKQNSRSNLKSQAKTAVNPKLQTAPKDSHGGNGKESGAKKKSRSQANDANSGSDEEKSDEPIKHRNLRSNRNANYKWQRGGRKSH
jgi:hypothetical protein